MLTVPFINEIEFAFQALKRYNRQGYNNKSYPIQFVYSIRRLVSGL